MSDLNHTSPTTELDEHIASMLRDVAEKIFLVGFGVLPIIFVPLSYAPKVATKVTYVVIILAVVLFFYAASLFFRGGISVRIPKLIPYTGLIVFATLVSSIFSGDVRDTLFGDDLGVQTAAFLLVIATTVVVTFLLLTKKVSIMKYIAVLVVSTTALAFFHILRSILGGDALSFGVFDRLPETPLGGWNDLGVYFGLVILLVLLALEQLPLTRWGRVIAVGLLVASLYLVALVNFTVVWAVLFLSSITVVLYSIFRHKLGTTTIPLGREVVGLNRITLATAGMVMVCSLLFLVFGLQLGNALSAATGVSYVEVRPSPSATLSIVGDVLKDHPLTGVGANRFSDAWHQYRNPAINETVFWNTTFESGYGYFLTALVTTGILGIASWIVFYTLIWYTGFHIVMRFERTDTSWQFIGIASFIASAYLWGMAFFFVPGPTLLILAALFTGLLIVSYIELLPQSIETYAVAAHRGMGYPFVAGLVVCVFFALFSAYGAVTQYKTVFDVRYATQSESLTHEERIRILKNAYETIQNDSYARLIAQYERDRITVAIQNANASGVPQQMLTQSAQNAVQYSRHAVEDDPTDPENRRMKASVYSLLTLSSNDRENTYQFAKEALDAAKDLDPSHPMNLYLEAELEVRKGDLAAAEAAVKEAIRMNPRFSTAYLLLSQIAIARGDVAGAIASTESAVLLNPNNASRYYLLGMLYSSNGSLQASRDAFLHALELSPDFANARYFLALVYVELGERDLALVELNRVRENNPENVQLVELIEELENGETVTSSKEAIQSTFDSITIPELESASTEPFDSALISQ